MPSGKLKIDDPLDYTDRDVAGCEVSPGPYGCLTCGLPQCKYDDPSWWRVYRRLAIDDERMNVYEASERSVARTAKRLRVARRTVQRTLRRVVAA